MRIVVAVAAALLTAGLTAAPSAVADPSDPAPADDPTSCNVPACIPGIQPGAVLGAPCNNPTYYSFGVTSWGRVLFCGSPRRYDPRWFRTTAVLGVKLEGPVAFNIVNKGEDNTAWLMNAGTTRPSFKRIRGP